MARNPTIERYAASTQTSAATITTLISFTMPQDDIACQIEWVVVGVEATGGEVTSYKAIVSFDNPSGGGSVVKVGATTVLYDIDEDTNVVFTEDTDGTNIRLRVTPSADTTDWVAHATVTFLRL